MRSSSYRRHARANNLKILVRDDVPDLTKDPAELSDSDSDSDDDGLLDSPSPTSPNFPPPPPQVGSPTPPPAEVSSTTTSTASLPLAETSSTATSAVSSQLPGETSTAISGITSQPPGETSLIATNTVSSQPTTLTSITSTRLPATQPTSTSASVTESSLSQNSDAVQAQASQSGSAKPVMSRDGAIALGTVGGVVLVAALLFIMWKCRRRRNRGDGDVSFKPSFLSGFRKIEEPRRPVTADYGSSAKTDSRIMDNLMAAAYAAEDGSASQYGAHAEKQRQYNISIYDQGPRQPAPTRQSDPPVLPVPDTGRGANSLYVNQLLSGFYKSPKTDWPSAPPDARMPPPVAPSVAGRTEVTATSESTWRTWGWSQHGKPKDSWVDRCIRLGGLR
ncbi:hypothetical protein F4804DRAFT_41579 [Jackrogersella minutella]|nr:hypothetical protein F4804DRAFT_41579 [Jackrogersella minutella]